MDYQTLTLFSVEEFTDIAHGMTARSTRSKTPIQRSKAIALYQSNDRPSTPSATDLDSRIAAANQLRKSNYANL